MPFFTQRRHILNSDKARNCSKAISPPVMGK